MCYYFIHTTLVMTIILAHTHAPMTALSHTYTSITLMYDCICTSTGTTEYCSISKYNLWYIYSLDSPIEPIIIQAQSPPSLLHSDYTLIHEYSSIHTYKLLRYLLSLHSNIT